MAKRDDAWKKRFWKNFWESIIVNSFEGLIITVKIFIITLIAGIPIAIISFLPKFVISGTPTEFTLLLLVGYLFLYVLFWIIGIISSLWLSAYIAREWWGWK